MKEIFYGAVTAFCWVASVFIIPVSCSVIDISSSLKTIANNSHH